MKNKIQELEKLVLDMTNEKRSLETKIFENQNHYDSELEKIKIELEGQFLQEMERMEKDNKQKIAIYEERLITQKNNIISEFELKMNQLKITYESNLETEKNHLKSFYEKLQGELIDNQRLEIEKLHREVENKITLYSNQIGVGEENNQDLSAFEEKNSDKNVSNSVDHLSLTKSIELKQSTEKLYWEIEIKSLKEKLRLMEVDTQKKIENANHSYYELETFCDFLKNEKEELNQKLLSSVDSFKYIIDRLNLSKNYRKKLHIMNRKYFH